MTDALLRIENNEADLVIEDGDVVLDEGLSTAVLVSLFSDARADEGQLAPRFVNRGGYWAERPTDPWGSTLWLEYRGKAVAETAERLRQATEESLAWLVENGIAGDVVVTADIAGPGKVDLAVALERGEAVAWPQAWEALQDLEATIGGFSLKVLPL